YFSWARRDKRRLDSFAGPETPRQIPGDKTCGSEILQRSGTRRRHVDYTRRAYRFQSPAVGASEWPFCKQQTKSRTADNGSRSASSSVNRSAGRETYAKR